MAAAVVEHQRRFGRLPATLDELVARGLTREPTVDQAGFPFDYDPTTGRVTVARQSPLWRPN